MSLSSLKDKKHQPIPRHVAIIMDGNGRWAKANGLPKVAGHQRGANSVKNAVKFAVKEKIAYLTLFGFSSENWNRPVQEVKDLMDLLKYYLKSEIDELNSEGVRFRMIGNRNSLDKGIKKLIEDSEKKTSRNNRLNLIIALSYGGRAEIVDTARKLAEEVRQGVLSITDFDENLFSSRIYTSDIPDPDLLIRTSGEKRISNFLLWQSAYAELVFIDTLWPDFSSSDFKKSISEFQSRERKYGA